MASSVKWPSLAADEKLAAKYLAASIEEALKEIERVTKRAMLIPGAKLDRAYIARLRTSLWNIAQESGVDITRGPYGKQLVDLMQRGALAVPGAGLGDLGTDLVETVLSNVAVDIKDILDQGVRLVHREMLSVVVAGKDLRKVADAIESKLTLSDEGVMTRRRAELIAHSEVHSVYRQAQVATGEALGFKCFEHVGPNDSRTTDISQQYLGKVHTAEEWDDISAKLDGDWRTYGLHYGERGGWIPVPCPEDNNRADAQEE